MKERPILFNSEMVRAILEGRKTQTRRVVKPQPCGGWAFDGVYGKITSHHPQRGKFGAFLRRGVGTPWPELGILPCPYGSPGDRLWVRETFFSFRHAGVFSTASRIVYRADYSGQEDEDYATECHGWKPSIHMPRWASRITLEITDIRVERLQEISEKDAIAEGVVACPDMGITAVGEYSLLWESINGKGSWDENPWVWVIEFRRLNETSAPNSLQPKPLTGSPS